MPVIARNQVNKRTREILPEELAAKFISNIGYLMALANNDASDTTKERVKQAFENNNKLIDKMLTIYSQLEETSAMFIERVNSNKTVSGKKSLLTHLTDGCAHLKIYPNVDFN